MDEYAEVWGAGHGHQVPGQFSRQDGARIGRMLDRQRRRITRKAKRRSIQLRLQQAAMEIERSLILATAIQRILIEKGVLAEEQVKAVAERLSASTSRNLLDDSAPSRSEESTARTPRQSPPA